MRIRTALVTGCSSFDQLKIVMFINVLKDGFASVLHSLAYLTRLYVNTLTLCKTALCALENDNQWVRPRTAAMLRANANSQK
jgi:hypothetical protein